MCSWLFNWQFVPFLAEKDCGDFEATHVADLVVLEPRPRTIAMDEDEGASRHDVGHAEAKLQTGMLVFTRFVALSSRNESEKSTY